MISCLLLESTKIAIPTEKDDDDNDDDGCDDDDNGDDVDYDN